MFAAAATATASLPLAILVALRLENALHFACPASAVACALQFSFSGACRHSTAAIFAFKPGSRPCTPATSCPPGMSVRPRLDDPAALVALLDQLSASPAVRTALSNKGFASLGSLAFAVSDMSDADEVRLFLRSTLSLADTDDAALVSADSACIRRLLFEASSAAPTASASSTKIAVPDLLHLRKNFLAKYPGELLTPDSAPSVDLLSLLKNHHDSQQSLWVPWRLRTSESDATRWEEARRPTQRPPTAPVFA